MINGLPRGRTCQPLRVSTTCGGGSLIYIRNHVGVSWMNASWNLWTTLEVMLREQCHVAVEARRDSFRKSSEIFISCYNCNYTASGSYFRTADLHDFLQFLYRQLFIFATPSSPWGLPKFVKWDKDLMTMALTNLLGCAYDLLFGR